MPRKNEKAMLSKMTLDDRIAYYQSPEYRAKEDEERKNNWKKADLKEMERIQKSLPKNPNRIRHWIGKGKEFYINKDRAIPKRCPVCFSTLLVSKTKSHFYQPYYCESCGYWH